MTAVDIVNLQKRYYMAHALRGLDLRIEQGKIVGLLGPNGAGKSTLLKICAGLVHPTSGKVEILGGQSPIRAKAGIAFVPEIDTFYPWMTANDALAVEASMFDDFDMEDAERLLSEMRLDGKAKVSDMSKGQRGRLKLVLAMARRAGLVLMDEPLSGIDPPSRSSILETIASRYRAGEQTIIISTHEVLESERLFEQVVFLSSGQVVLEGNADQLRAEHGKSINDLFGEVCFV